MNAACQLPFFEYRGFLGRGGTAEVARVYAKELNREVALKCALSEQADPDVNFAKLAQREFRLVGHLRLPCIARLYGLSDSAPEYLILELCPGPTLDDVGRIGDVRAAVNLISAFAAGLGLLRAHGIIHGDLKPHNIFLPPNWREIVVGSLFFPKLSDFSLGRREDESEELRAGLGTVGYLAPETISAGQTSHQSDLFALGIIAYQMLSGKHPFMEDDHDPVKVNSRTQEEEPEPLEECCPGLPPAVVDLVGSLLAKEPGERPSSGWEVCERLTRTGAVYPYGRLLQPKWFLDCRRPYADIVTRTLRVDLRQRRRLDNLTDCQNDRLRQLLTGNFVRGNLKFTGTQFVFRSGIHRPHSLLRRTLGQYGRASFRHRRLMIKAAIAGSIEAGFLIDPDVKEVRRSAGQPLLEALLQFLTPAGIRHLSASWGPRLEHQEQYRAATTLYLQAGDLEGAERCAHLAAVALHKGNDNDAAREVLGRVIEFASIAGRDFEIRQLLMLLGDIQKSAGEAEDALATYSRIIELYQGRSPDSLLGETYKDLGDLFKLKQNVAKGLEALSRARDIYEAMGDELELSRTLNNTGNLYWLDGDYAAALKCYRKALHTQRRLTALLETASTLNNIGSIYALTGRLSRAILIFEQSLHLKKELGHAGEIARTLNNLGYTYYRCGKLSRAIDSLRESLVLNQRIGAKKEVLFNLDNLASAMIAAGQLRQSLDYLKTGLALASELKDRPHQGSFSINVAVVLRRMGRYSDAAEHLDRAEAVIAAIDDRQLPMLLKVNRAWVRFRLGDTERAVALAGEALRLAEEVGDKSEELNILMLLVRISDDPDMMARARQLAEELNLEREKIILDFIRIEQKLHHTPDQARTLPDSPPQDKIERLAEDIELPWMLTVAGEVALAHGKRHDALSCAERSLAVARQSNLLPETMQALILLGRIQFGSREYEACYRSYREALGTAKELANNIAERQDAGRFQKQPSVQFLVSEIKTLAKLMGNQSGRLTPEPAR